MKRRAIPKKGKTLKPSTIRNKADALLTPIIKAKFPRCILCPNPTQVAHHHVHKSKSTRLRYDLDNLIPLCNGCHFKLHQNESYWAGKVIEIRGMDWFKQLDKTQNEIVKADRYYYQAAYERLSALL